MDQPMLLRVRREFHWGRRGNSRPLSREYLGASWQLDPLARLGRLYRGVEDGLRARPVVEARHARALIADGVNELEGLVVAERNQGVALLRIAGRPGPAPEFRRDDDGLEAGSASRAGLEFVPLAGAEDERALAAIEFDGVEAAPAFVATAGEFAAFQHAARPVGELGENGRPIIDVAQRALAGGVKPLGVRHEAPHGAEEQVRKINPV